VQSIATMTTQGFAHCEKLTRYFFRKQERPDFLLRSQLGEAKDILERELEVRLTVPQETALLCLFSDIVAGYVSAPPVAVAHWHLTKVLNQRMFQVAAGQFLSFCYLKGKMDPRALRKRICEQQLFVTGKLQFE
jgi:GH24 family phage-related lysozyme (muramidase)